MKNFIAFLCFFIPALNAVGQCSVSVASSSAIPNPSNYLCSNTFGQTFTPGCSGPLKSVAFPTIYFNADDFRGSGFYVFCRIRNASGTLLATSAQTDQWYPGGAVTFDFSCAGIGLASGTVYQFELASTYTACVYLTNYVTSSTYSGGNAVLNGTAYPAYDLLGWTVTIGNGAIAAASSSATQTLTASSCNVFYNSSNEAIAQVQSGSTAMGSTTARVFVQSSAPTYNTQPYVRRHYDIAPATNASTATATNTLYFSQADFDNYNLNRGTYPALPTGPSDAAGAAALRITQQHGTSATGAPGTFTGWAGTGPANKLITPSGVAWNSAVSRWEVTFPVTGFSGFFAHSGASSPLPVKLIGFSGRAEGASNRLDWQTAVEDMGTTFSIERSNGHTGFELLSVASGKGSNSMYTFYDRQVPDGTTSYRLKIIEAGGAVTYSSAISILNSGEGNGAKVSIYPVPASQSLTISCARGSLDGSTAAVHDAQGSVVVTFTLSGTQVLDIRNWAAGVYTLRLADGTALKILKQ